MRGAIVIRPEKCTGCRMCELACSSKKEGMFIPERSRIRVVSDSLEGWSRPAVCLQCEDPMCMPVCPVQAITRSETPGGDGFVHVDAEKCIGCKRCSAACPFGAIVFGADSKAAKCDLCGGSPNCVAFCFYGCLSFVGLSEEAHARRGRKVNTLTKKACRTISKEEGFRRRAAFSEEATRIVSPDSQEQS